MSAWRILLKELHDAGGRQYAQRLSLDEAARRQLLRRGLATLDLDGRRAVYVITPLGHDVATGRVVLRPPCYRLVKRRAWRWVATWLRPLPERCEFHGSRPATLDAR